MNNKLPPQEPVVIIPIGIDCRELKFRSSGIPGSITWGTQAEMKAMSYNRDRINEILAGKG